MVDYACITWRNISIYSLFKTMGMFRQRGNQSAPCYPELVTVSTNNLRKGIVLLSLSISTVETLHIPEISNCRGSSTHLHLPTFPLVMPGGNDYLVMIYSFNSAWEQSSQLYSTLTLLYSETGPWFCSASASLAVSVSIAHQVSLVRTFSLCLVGSDLRPLLCDLGLG